MSDQQENEEKLVKYMSFDPPSGWKYGFPKYIRLDSSQEDLKQILLDSGYPGLDIEFALNHSRFIYSNQEDLLKRHNERDA